MSDKVIKRIISQGVDFLAREQQKDGSFLSHSTFSRRSFAQAKKYHSTFPSTLILSSICRLKKTTKLKPIKEKLAKFLLKEKSENWSFNYWARNSKQAKKMPYPDDLDVTFCALSALTEYNSQLIDGSALAKITMILTATEEKEGGPYRTWLVPKTAGKVWQDVDLAVNSNVAYFLSLQGVSLSKINSLVEKAINEDNYTSPYYPLPYPILYFISRFYKGKKTKKIKDFLFSKQDKTGKWNNPLNTALAVSALIDLGVSTHKLKKSISYLTKSYKKKKWLPEVFCIDPAVKGKKYYACSSALTYSFCMEALTKYQKETEEPLDSSTSLGLGAGREKEEQKNIYQEVVRKAGKRFSFLGDDLKKKASDVLKTTLKSDRDRQIVLLPYFFKKSLGRNGKKVSNELIVQLGLANLYGWMTYTIYDDFLDEEGDPKMLSVANMALRELTEIFLKILPKESGFPSFLRKIMDIIDSANAWEVSHCRTRDYKNSSFKIPNYGDFSQLAHKSIGHVLGPAAILFSLGYTSRSSEVKNLMIFFKYYLTARQLNDDAHDWADDLKRGQINSIGSLVLRKVQKLSGSNLNLLHLQEIFWYNISVGICQKMKRYAELAKQSLRKVSVIADTALLEQLLVPIEYSVEKTLKERNESIKFLKSYAGKK